MATMIGTFERNVHGRFIYKIDGGYLMYNAQTMQPIYYMPRWFNIWQPQLIIWILAKGL